MPDPAQRPQRSASMTLALLLLGAAAGAAQPAQGQGLGDVSRLAGIDAVAIEASASWDELITTGAGGATAAQFEDALLQGLEAALQAAPEGPTLDPDAPVTLWCHVDTFYDSGLIIYSVRASYLREDADGERVVAWLKSWVGSYTAQQLHVIYTLSDQCAEAFLTDWAAANGA